MYLESEVLPYFLFMIPVTKVRFVQENNRFVIKVVLVVLNLVDASTIDKFVLIVLFAAH